MIARDVLQSVLISDAGREACLKYLGYLNAHMARYGIDRPLRIAAFLAQVAHESSDFTRVVENLNYSAQGLANTWPNRFMLPNRQPTDFAHKLHRNPQAIANHVYANRMGNGDPETGDGWRYRGRGLKQITGKDNYRDCGKALGIDLLREPDRLLEPDEAVESACWYWASRDLNRVADKGDFLAVTKAINGGTIGHGSLTDDRNADRVDYYDRLLKALRVAA